MIDLVGTIGVVGWAAAQEVDWACVRRWVEALAYLLALLGGLFGWRWKWLAYALLLATHLGTAIGGE